MLLYLLQLPVAFQNLYETRRHRIQWGNRLWGLCYDDNRIYCVDEWKDSTGCLSVYDTSYSEDGKLSLLNKVVMRDVPWSFSPHVDSSHRVYVPCGESGVRVFRCIDGHLLPARDPLKCVKHARSICVNTSAFLCDRDTDVCLVSVSSDTVIRRLEKPAQVRGLPSRVSVLGETVLACYGDNTLVTYRSDNPTPGRVLQTPGLERVESITTDSNSSSFLVTDQHAVYALSDKLIWHRIYTVNRVLQDCAVVQSQLWLGYYGGYIAVLTSR